MRENFNFKETTFDGINYVCPTWGEMGNVSEELANKINYSGEKFDCIVPLANGGLTWSRDIADKIETPNIIPMRVKSYTNVNSNDEIELIYGLPIPVKNKDVLLLDDVFDSGKTIKFAKDYIINSGANKVMTAALCCKPRSIIKPDFCSGFITDAWVVFPHEVREFVVGSCLTWFSHGIKNEEIRGRFLDIGLPIKQVDYFMSRVGFSI